jgi:hypothetical protein
MHGNPARETGRAMGRPRLRPDGPAGERREGAVGPGRPANKMASAGKKAKSGGGVTLTVNPTRTGHGAAVRKREAR